MAYVAIDGIIFNIALRQKVRNEMDSRSHLFFLPLHRRREGDSGLTTDMNQSLAVRSAAVFALRRRKIDEWMVASRSANKALIAKP